MKAFIRGIEVDGTPEEIAAIVREFSAEIIAQFSVLPDLTVCHHEFPDVWHGVIPPACRKCGLRAYGPTMASTSTLVDVS